jgi:outer membrane protein assembly factor BamB
VNADNNVSRSNMMKPYVTQLFLATVLTSLAVPLSARVSEDLHLTATRTVEFAASRAPSHRLLGRDQTPRGQQDGNWTSWRGPLGSGEAFGAPPTEWSEDKNIKWKTAIPGLGNSTPIVWQDHLYLTTAIQTDEGGKAAGGGKGLGKVFDFRVICIHRLDGSEVWNVSVTRSVPHEPVHGTASQASNSPVTDGKHIYAHFGSRGIFCLDMSGKQIWSKQLGMMRINHQFGEGSSPALAGNALIINWDHDGDSFICALNKKNGKQLWRKPREEGTTWATPAITKANGKTLAIVPASGKSCAYNVKNGKIVWTASGLTANVIPSPIVRDGVAYLMSGYQGTVLQAIKLAGAKGDITNRKNILWTHKRQTSYVPSALLYGKHIYFLRRTSAVLSCLDMRTGTPVYEGQRLAGMRTIYASPVGASGYVYLPSREGKTKVFKAGATYEDVATNELDDQFDASPVIIGDDLYLRGHSSLYCVSEKN